MGCCARGWELLLLLNLRQLFQTVGEHSGARAVRGYKFLPKGGGQALAQPAKHSAGITTPRSVQKTRGWVTWGWELVVNMELMILEGFSNPDDSMIILFSIPLCSAPSLDSCLV